MREISKLQQIPWPDSDLQDNFDFDSVCDDGTYNWHFKWFNDRWNGWVTLPSGEIRQFGIYPNVISGSGHTDYGCVFVTDLTTIDYNSLFFTTLYLITWE